MRNLILLLLAGPLLYLLIPSWQVQTRHPIGEYTFCIPPQYVVFSDRDFPGKPGSEYDVSEPGGYVRITFPPEQILLHAPAFHTKIPTPADYTATAYSHQSISVTVTAAHTLDGLKRTIRKERDQFPSLELVPDPTTGMARLMGSSQIYPEWLFIHPSADGTLDLHGERWLWGSCSVWEPKQSDAYKCRRELRHAGLSMKYHIASVNMPHYPAIDRMILQQLKQWECSKPGKSDAWDDI
ncbi:hypothetical protein [Thauera butanivorans]|uniref:hypothetical protein n=1 Tax=Thauera butanivorans TaxID=86174 RepID=UPI000838641B|nr:hypothetical protein [Thauera butanivorans]